MNLTTQQLNNNESAKLMTSDIRELIDRGENTGIEFKSARIRPEGLAREMVAFANATGGMIFLGVEDDRHISGLDSTKNYEEWCMNIARHNINPPLQVSWETVCLDNQSVGVIQVPKGSDKPYQTIDGKFYIRVGTTARMASVHELLRLFQQSGLFHFDLTGVEGTSIRNLNLHKLSAYFEVYSVQFEMMPEAEKVSLLQNTDILTSQGTLTVAGLLVFGLQPQRHLRQASATFAHFAGSDVTAELLDKQTIEGNLDVQIDTTTAVIRNNLRQPSTIIGNRRVEAPAYPPRVFRELIVNACCHRNYAIAGSQIRVLLYDDRLEVISPGRLPNSVTVEKLKAGVSYAVNPVIVKFMENLNYIDKLGRGLPMVWQEACKLGLAVDFVEQGEEFRVILALP